MLKSPTIVISLCVRSKMFVSELDNSLTDCESFPEGGL